MDNIDRMLVKAWDHCRAEREGGYKYLQTNEYFMFHHIAHMAYHFVHGGCGIKPFIDLLIIKNKIGYDEKKAEALLAKEGFFEFYKKAMSLSEIWFDDKNHTPTTNDIEDFILGGGVCAEGDRLTTPLKAAIATEIFAGETGPQVQLLIARLGNSAGLLGAAALWM